MRFHIAQVGLQLDILQRITLNFSFFRFKLLQPALCSAGDRTKSARQVYRQGYTSSPVPNFYIKQAPVFRFPICFAGNSIFPFCVNIWLSPASVSPICSVEHINLSLIWQRLFWALISPFMRREDCKHAKSDLASGPQFLHLFTQQKHPFSNLLPGVVLPERNGSRVERQVVHSTSLWAAC